jgi:rhamnosyltransferase
MSSSTAFVFAHFSPAGVVSSSFRALVREARRRSEIVRFVSTGLDIGVDDELHTLANVVSRENIGYDFWSYRVGLLDVLEAHDVDRVVLVNNSFVALDPARLFDGLLQPVEGPRIRGLTVSHEVSRHAQSYLVSIEDRALLRSREFESWWTGMVPVSNRDQVVQLYEIGFSRHFHELGVPISAAYEPSSAELLVALSRAIASLRWAVGQIEGDRVSIDLRPAKSLNPTHFLWDFLFRRFSLLKLELITSNPTEQNLDALVKFLQHRDDLMTLVRGAMNEKSGVVGDAPESLGQMAVL